MKTTLLKNKWARGLTEAEVKNWIEAMIEIGRFSLTGYWTLQKLVRCPFGKPLAIVGGNSDD